MKILQLFTISFMLLNLEFLQAKNITSPKYVGAGIGALVAGTTAYNATKFYCQQQKGMVFKNGRCIVKKTEDESQKTQDLTNQNKQQTTMTITEISPKDQEEVIAVSDLSETQLTPLFSRSSIPFQTSTPLNFAPIQTSKSSARPMYFKQVAHKNSFFAKETEEQKQNNKRLELSWLNL